MSSLAEEAPFLVEVEPGVRLCGHLYDAPTGPVGVFVHGFLSDAGGAKSLHLADHARRRGYAWLRFNQRGHGNSSNVTSYDAIRTLRISRLLSDLEAILAQFAPRRVILIGSSMGGWLSVLAAQRRPTQVAGLLLIAPAFNFLRSIAAQLSEDERTAWACSGVHRFASRYGTGDYELEHEALADAERYDVFCEPLTLSCPTVVVHGESDEAVPLALSERFLAHLSAPASALHVVAGGDHRLNGAMPLLCDAVDRLWEARTS